MADRLLSASTSLPGIIDAQVSPTTDRLQAQLNGSGAVTRFNTAYRGILNGTAGRVAYLCLGDSVGYYPAFGIVDAIEGAIGNAGFVGDVLLAEVNGTWGGGVTVGTSGGASYTDGTVNAYDYTYWPTGQQWVVPVGGVLDITINGGAQVATDFIAYYAKRPVAGTFKLELLSAAGAVLQTIASTDANNATVAFGKASFTVTAQAAKMRVTGLTGTCILPCFGFINKSVSGLIRFGIKRGGLSLTNINTAAVAIWSGVVADIQPALATYTMREDVPTVTAQLPIFLANYNAAYATTDWVLNGVWQTSPGDSVSPVTSQPSWLESEAIRAVANTNGYAFADYFSALPMAHRTDPTNVHVTDAEALIFSETTARVIGIYGQIKSMARKERYGSPLIRVTRVEFGGTIDPNVAPAGELVGVAGLDAYFSFNRNFSIGSGYGGTEVPLIEFASGGGGDFAKVKARVGTGIPSILTWGSTRSGVATGKGFGLIASQTTASDSNTTRFMKQSDTVRRARNEPFYSLELGGTVGTGTPMLYFDSAATAFTTDADYTSAGEARTGLIAATKRIWTRILVSGGPVSTIIGAVKESLGLGTSLVSFTSTDANFTTVGNYQVSDVRMAVDAGGTNLVIKVNVGGTLKTATIALV